MDAWGRLTSAGLTPPDLGPPPRALRDPGGARRCPGAAPEAPQAADSVVWVWEQLVRWTEAELSQAANASARRHSSGGLDTAGGSWSLRRMDIQIFNQLCTLGLEIQALREETEVTLDEEGEDLEPSPSDWLTPEFEITI